MCEPKSSNEGASIAKMEGTAGFDAFWNERGGVSIEQWESGEEGGLMRVCLTVAEAECLLNGLAVALGYKIAKMEGFE